MNKALTASVLAAILAFSGPLNFSFAQDCPPCPPEASASVEATASADFFIPTPTVVIHARPHLVVVPGTSVEVAEGVNTNLFFASGRWYMFDNSTDEWFVSASFSGPFLFADFGVVPVGLFAVPVAFFATPPLFFVGFSTPVLAWNAFGVNVVNNRVVVNKTVVNNR